MTIPTFDEALEAVYASLHADNKDLDMHIAVLKKAMQAQGVSAVEVEPGRLPSPNRQGRKVLQSYFRQRGVNVTFAEAKAS